MYKKPSPNLCIVDETGSAEKQRGQAEGLHKASGLVVVSDHNRPYLLSAEPCNDS